MLFSLPRENEEAMKERKERKDTSELKPPNICDRRREP
jgi:hypothetical protein